MVNKRAFIFPAFITEFTHNEINFLNENSVDIKDYLKIISETINVNLPEFDYDSKEYYNNELFSQLIAYAFSCAINDVLYAKDITPDVIAGYSMGIYASLYAAGCITFEDGAKLIQAAFNSVKEIAETGMYGMGAIIGLTVRDTSEIIEKSGNEIEIININNEHSLVIAGRKNDVSIVLGKAKEEGAISTSILTVNTPYHSSYLLQYSELFKKFIDTLNSTNCKIPVISTYDQRTLTDIHDVQRELVINLTRKINWHNTMLHLLDLGINEMYECGAGKDLKKISRFIKGDYCIKSINKA